METQGASYAQEKVHQPLAMLESLDVSERSNLFKSIDRDPFVGQNSTADSVTVPKNAFHVSIEDVSDHEDVSHKSRFLLPLYSLEN